MKLRWLPYEEKNAAWNMAVDEAILEAHLQGLVPPTLRFYGWAPPAVSLGYAQKLGKEVIDQIRANGFEVVRRPTGGRAVLHEGDLTYSFIGSSIGSATNRPDSDQDAHEAYQPESQSLQVSSGSKATLLAKSVSASYLEICNGLLAGLDILGVHAEIGRSRNPYARYEDCFQTTTNADLQVDGLKVVGSAQLRRKHAVLQHGSILLHQEQALLPDLLALRDEPGIIGSDTASGDKENLSRHRNLFDLIGERSISEIEAAFLKGFSTTMGATFERGRLTAFEQELSIKLTTKYRC